MSKILDVLKCRNCKVEFKQNRPWQEFCSSKCKSQFWNEVYAEEKLKKEQIRLVKESEK